MSQPHGDHFMTSGKIIKTNLSDMAGEVSPYENARQIPFHLHRVRDKLNIHLRAVFDPFDLTDPQWRVLRTLSVVDEIDTMELARRAFVLGPSLSRMLRDLTGRELIHRRVDESDARRFYYRLSERGWDVVKDVLPRFRPIYALIEKEMGQGNVAHLCDLLGQLTEVLSLSPAAIADSDK